jgi:tetratricopeptide (TPR) repeat protein
MLDFEEAHKRFVTPKWLPLAKAVNGRDLAVPRLVPFELDRQTRVRLLDDYAEFKESPNPLKASDLMGAAFVVGEKNIAVEAAEYFVKSRSSLGAGLKFANHILRPQPADVLLGNTGYQIARLKSSLINLPKNPLVWIEMARLYTIKGQIEKARRAVVVAVSLAPSNRFVIRSAARFYMHTHEFDSAWQCVKRALDLNADPWIEATLVNLAMSLNRDPKRLIRRSPKDVSPGNIYHYSELIETRGMLELESGNSQRARKDFRLAWTDPSRNVVTHAEWILRKSLPGMADSTTLDLSASPEAETWKFYSALELDEAMVAVRQWALEEPYSRHPWIIGSSISCGIDRFKEAESLARQGLVANPRDFLLNNNLAFALLRDSRTEDAEMVLRNAPQPQTTTERPVSLATRGLLEFKKGAIEHGRLLYLQAIEESEKINAPRFVAKAYLNLAIAEVEAGGEHAAEFVSRALAAAKNRQDPDITLTLQQLQRVIEKKKLLAALEKGEGSKQGRELAVLLDSVRKGRVL